MTKLIYTFKTFFLSAYFVPGVILGARDVIINNNIKATMSFIEQSL